MFRRSVFRAPNNEVEAGKERMMEESEQPKESPPPRSSNTHSFYHYLLYLAAHTTHNNHLSLSLCRCQFVEHAHITIEWIILCWPTNGESKSVCARDSKVPNEAFAVYLLWRSPLLRTKSTKHRPARDDHSTTNVCIFVIIIMHFKWLTKAAAALTCGQIKCERAFVLSIRMDAIHKES